MSPFQGICTKSQLGLYKSTNSVFNKAKSLQKSRSNLLSDEKGPYQGDPNGCLVIHLYYKFIVLITEDSIKFSLKDNLLFNFYNIPL